MASAKNFSKKKFMRIGITEAIPWSYKLDGETKWRGFCIDIINTLAEGMNFDYHLVPAVEEDTMPPNASKKEGIIADLVSGKTDMIIAATSMTAAKGELVDYITPSFEYSGLSIVMRKPFRTSSFFKFMTVLSLDVWLSIIFTVLITALVFWIIEKFYASENNKTKSRFTLKESLWMAITTFACQGNSNVPSSLPHRVLISAYWVFVLVMMTTFTANMAAFLTVERLQTPISSLWELTRQTRIEFTVVENSHAHSYFRNMKFAEDTLFRIWKDLALTQHSENEYKYLTWDYPVREEYRHALKLIEKNNPVPTAAIGFEKVLENESGFALIHDFAEIRYRTYRDCRLIEIGDIFGERPYSIAVAKNSTLKNDLTIRVLDLHEQRFFEGLSAKYWNSSDLSLCSEDDETDCVTLESLGGVFISTLCGITLALIMLVVEISHEIRKKRNMQQKTLFFKRRPRSKSLSQIRSVSVSFKKILYQRKKNSSIIANLLASCDFNT